MDKILVCHGDREDHRTVARGTLCTADCVPGDRDSRSSWLRRWPPGRPDPDVDGVACACTCREGKVDGRDLDARGSRVPEPSRVSAGTTEAGHDRPTTTNACTRLLNYLLRALPASLALSLFPFRRSFLERSVPCSFLSPFSKRRAPHLLFLGSSRTRTHALARPCMRSHGSWNDYRYTRLSSPG